MQPKCNVTILALSFTLWLALCLLANAQVPRTCYRVADVATPEGIAPEVSAVDFTPAGDLVLCFRRGYIYIRDRDTLLWRRFASGLHTPLGIANGEFSQGVTVVGVFAQPETECILGDATDENGGIA